MKISISMPDGVYEEVVKSAEYNARTVSGEILFRIMRFGDKVGTIRDVKIDKVEETKGVQVPSGGPENTSEHYGEVIEEIKKINDPDFQADGDDMTRMRRMIREAGLSYNEGKKQLWKQEGEVWVLVKEF